jgi:hypothetical protein
MSLAFAGRLTKAKAAGYVGQVSKLAKDLVIVSRSNIYMLISSGSCSLIARAHSKFNSQSHLGIPFGFS